MVLAPVLSDFSFHTYIGEKKPPRGKLCGGDSFRDDESGNLRGFQPFP
jgi:hypothetical protein